jgi:hypothetical protein
LVSLKLYQQMKIFPTRGCTSNSLALNGPALGAVASEDAIRNTVLAGGFTKFRRAPETPFNRIFEARK